MDVIKGAEKLSSLNDITPDFINRWNASGHEDTAPVLYQILLTAAESLSGKEKNKKKTPLPVCFQICHSM